MTHPNYKPYFIFAVIVAAGLLVVFFISAGFYPIAVVNGTLISARSFSREYQAADLSYHKALDTYGKKAFGDRELAQGELQALAMQSMVEDILVADGARREAGSDLGSLVDSKLSQLGSDAELEKAASNLYGLTKDEFWKLVLVPQARRDVLAGRLFLRGQKIDDWLADARKSAKIFIFSSQLHWNGQKVEAKKP